MRIYLTLVGLFWKHLIRRKSLWLVLALVAFVLLVNFAVRSQMNSMLESGVRYDIATRRAIGALDSYAEQIRVGSVLLVLVVAALVAPPSRKEGTTQFLLTLSVSRLRLALAQFGALALFILAGCLVLHIGYFAAAYRLGILRWPEALFAWLLLLLPLLLVAAPSFCLSLSRPAVVVYAILLGVPYLLMPLLEAWVGSWSDKTPVVVRLVFARAIDNVEMLFPHVDPFILWPKLTASLPSRPPFPSWGWEALNTAAAVGLWIVAGLWAYRRHDFGSRIPTK